MKFETNPWEVTMKRSEKIRKDVSKAYASAVSEGSSCLPSDQTSKKGCCSSGEIKSRGGVVEAAGYSQKELGTLPQDAVENSFGCGNPVAFSRIKEGEVVVDLGSGAGIDLILAAQKVGPNGRIIGIDMTEAMLEKAQANIKKSGLKNIEVRKGIIEDMPVETSTVDWVISNCVINLSPEKNKVFKEIHRILKPGGKMLISDIVVEELPPWVRENESLYHSCISGAIREKEYLEGLRKAGLTNVKVESRLFYTGDQIRALVESELSQMDGIQEFLSSQENRNTLHETLGSLEGKIWSAKVYAEKP